MTAERQGDEPSGRPKDYPPGVQLLRTLEGHQGRIYSVAFHPGGHILATGSDDNTIKLWDEQSGQLLRTIQGTDRIWSVAFDPAGLVLASGGTQGVSIWAPQSGALLHQSHGYGTIKSLAFDPTGQILASGGFDFTVRLLTAKDFKMIRVLEGNRDWIFSVAFDPTGETLATIGDDRQVRIWETKSGKLLHALEGNNRRGFCVCFDRSGHLLASASSDGTVKLWEARSGKLLRTLEGHTDGVRTVAISSDGRLLASMSMAGNVRIWRCDTWDPVGDITSPTATDWAFQGLSFHPVLPVLAIVGSPPNTPPRQLGRVLHLWQLDLEVLLGKAGALPEAKVVHHTTGKVVLVGDHSVGKSGLGYRMVHGRFEAQPSTHGQQFWVFPALGKRRGDGTECEAILWDLAGQPDYRLVHALFLDDADLALVLFDAADIRDPLHGVAFWLRQLETAGSRCAAILVGSREDRGRSTLTGDELAAFCRQQGIAGPIHTSALTGEGVAELIERMKSLIPWDDKPAVVTTTTFKRIKDFVLGLKEADADGRIIVGANDLRRMLEANGADWQFTDAEMLKAVEHLENYGYVKRLRTSKGERRILLAPNLLNNLASSFVLEARRNPKGLGALEEQRLLAGGYAFPELANLSPEDRAVLLDSATLLFLEHNVCFRETDPLRMESYLVFPELINLKKPLAQDEPSRDAVAYTVSGATENVFASLVVLLGYTHTFTRTNQWQNHARYEVGDRLLCGFRQDAESDGELDFVLYFGPTVPEAVQTLFQGLFESFLARRNLKVTRFKTVVCGKCGHQLDRAVVRQRMKEGKGFTFCNGCGKKLTLPEAAAVQLTREERAQLATQRRAADERTRFEQAIFRVQAYAAGRKIRPPECFISYAWGVKEHERWVEKSLAEDLQKSGIIVVLDRWENAKIGASIPRFVERVAKCDRVLVVGTPLYREKYDNDSPMGGFVVAAEGDLIGKRMIGSEASKESVLPALLAGRDKSSFPELLQGRVYADFRQEQRYFITAFDLVLSLYGIKPGDPAVAYLRESLVEEGLRQAP
jgi:GTPase SAR1 family protein